MSLFALNGQLRIPHYPDGFSSLALNGQDIIDATGEHAGVVFQIPKSGTVTKIGFYVRTVTTPQPIQAALYNLGSYGAPNKASLYGGCQPGQIASPTAATWFEATLATPATVVAGAFVHSAVEFVSTIGNLTIGYCSDFTTQRYPYPYLYAAGYGSRNSSPASYLVYSDGSYAPIGASLPMSVNTAAFSYNNAEYALGFNLPFAFRVVGLSGFYGLDNGGSASLQAVYTLYQGTSSLSTVSMFSNYLPATSKGWLDVLLATPVEITADTTYYFGLKSASASLNILLPGYLNFPSQAVMDCGCPFGRKMWMGNRVGAGAWTDTLTSRPMFKLIVDQMPAAGAALGLPGIGGLIR
jgi:hypothetical protein